MGFFRSQAAHVSIEAKEQAAQAMCNSIAQQILTLSNLTVSDAASINDTVATSMFSTSHKTKLAQTVSDKCIQLQSGVGSKQKRNPQTVNHACNYFTAQDWLIFSAEGVTMAQKMIAMSDRLKLLWARGGPAKTYALL